MTESDEHQVERKTRTPFLIAISGARPEVLERCPTERIKFQSLGWAILITCGMAIVSMWFALTSAMGFNPVLSFPVAVLWGLIIMGIDRWLVTSMPLDGKRKFFIALPRLALALLLGSLISTPIVLRIFESEINNQISIIKAQNVAAFDSSTQKSAIQATINKWQASVASQEAVIDSNGTASINPNTDPTVIGLTAQLQATQATAASDYAQWMCQLYGKGAGCTTPKGNGPLAQATEKRYNADEAKINALNSAIQARENALQTTNASSAATKVAQAKSALPSAQAQLAAAQAEENSLTGNFNSTNSASNGLLIRLKALDQLAAGSSTLQAARILLFLLFLVIEVLPVTVKLLQPSGNYEEILKRQVANELSQAQRELRGGTPRSFTGRPGENLRPTMADTSIGDPRRRRRRDPIDEEFEQVWQEHTRAAPVSDWESRAGTAYLPSEDEVTGPSRMDEILRDLPDTRALGNLDERQGGTERRYSNDDL
jgi:hypothetical protein